MKKLLILSLLLIIPGCVQKNKMLKWESGSDPKMMRENISKGEKP